MSSDFNSKSIESSNKGILVNEKGSKHLLVSFGGVNQGLGMPVFEFFNSINDLKCDKIFFRDFSQMWYQKGVDDVVNDINSLMNFINNEIIKNKYTKVIFLGNSMGGYAAILLGVLIKVDRVISFAPQTFIDKKKRFFFGDRRWARQMNNIHKNKNKYKQFFDLKEVIKKHTDLNQQIDVYYSSKHRLDRIHAERLKGFKNVNLHDYNKGGHAVVKILRDSGELNALLSKLF